MDRHAFLVGDVGQAVVDGLAGQAAEIVPLAAGQDGGQDAVGLGGAEDEDDVGGRFLQGLEEGVGSLAGEHVGFVDDVDLAPVLGGLEMDLVADLPDLFNAAIAGRVQFDDVQVAALVDGHADGAPVAGVAFLRVQAIDGLGQDSGGGGLAAAAGAAEQVAVADPALHDRLAEGVAHMFLAGQVGEGAWAATCGNRLGLRWS